MNKKGITVNIELEFETLHAMKLLKFFSAKKTNKEEFIKMLSEVISNKVYIKALSEYIFHREGIIKLPKRKVREM